MIDREKVIRMNRLAMAVSSEKDRESEISRFRKRDYLALRMILTGLCATAAWLLMTALVVVLLIGSNPDRIKSPGQAGAAAACWFAGYLLFCAGMMVLALRLGERRYRRAREWQARKEEALAGLIEYCCQETVQDKESKL